MKQGKLLGRDLKPIRAPWQTPEAKPPPEGQIKQPRTERCRKCGWQVTTDYPHEDYFWQYQTNADKPSDGHWLCCFCSRNRQLLLRPIQRLQLMRDRAAQLDGRNLAGDELLTFLLCIGAMLLLALVIIVLTVLNL